MVYDKSLELGADLVKRGLDLGERDCDLIDIVLNAIRDVDENPDISLDNSIRNHGDIPSKVRGWWSSWTS